MTNDPPRVLLACPGLDHVHRGFETFARECFEALRHRGDVRVELVKGSGPSARGERSVPTLLRDAPLARAVGRATRREPFVAEHATFTASLLPVLARRPCDVVYFSEWHVGRLLARSRRVMRAPFRLVFCNGAFAGERYAAFDLVQQLVPGALDYAVAAGQPRELQVVLPLGVAMPADPPPPGSASRDGARRALGLPESRRIVLSAGALTAADKRMDTLIREIASLPPEQRPFLLLAGQEEAGTPAIRSLAGRLLGAEGHRLTTVTPERMPQLYGAADAFVLASLAESFGRVLVEAQSHGLPVLAHEHPVISWVLGTEGDTRDLTRSGAIAEWVAGLGPEDFSDAARARRHRAAYERFSWYSLADDYAAMLRGAAAGRRAPGTALP